ncbi:hypothetical protein OG357_17565 [Streptomyces sp. NBC_01255]|uniref:DUF7683 domain-containing protein n=1 Tax=Streptomyces sp. NBC_01255 TaxID=2903798 RepID=UPI002E357195|nr:hypothetical protein [Streptomyces sp. NBC_01255]
MPSEEPGVVWSLQGFSKVDEFLRTEFPISRDQILRLREVIEPDADDPWMFLCYAVPVELWPAVDAILQCGPPDPGLDYLTDCHAA